MEELSLGRNIFPSPGRSGNRGIGYFTRLETTTLQYSTALHKALGILKMLRTYFHEIEDTIVKFNKNATSNTHVSHRKSTQAKPK